MEHTPRTCKKPHKSQNFQQVHQIRTPQTAGR